MNLALARLWCQLYWPTKTQHMHIWRLMKKCLQKVKEHTSERRPTKYFCFPLDFVLKRLLLTLELQSHAAIFSLTCHVWSRYYQPCQSLGKNKNQSLTSALKCVLSFSEGISSLEVIWCRYVSMCFSMYLTLTSVQLKPQSGTEA